jgi:hypothetical protein
MLTGVIGLYWPLKALQVPKVLQVLWVLKVQQEPMDLQELQVLKVQRVILVLRVHKDPLV